MLPTSDFLALRKSGEYTGPLAFAYGRVSHKDQIDGQSVSAQGDRAFRYFELEVKPRGVAWGGFFGEQKQVSASKIPFAKRPAGKLICDRLQAGDCLIFDKIDRAWRNSIDFTVTREWIRRRGVHAFVVNCLGASFEWESPMGKMILTMLVGFAQFEADSTSDRTKRAFRHKRDKKIFFSGRLPMGCQKILVEGRKPPLRSVYKLEWDPDKIALMDRIVLLSDVNHYEMEQIADILNEEAHKGDKPWRKSAFNTEDYWTRKKVSELYHRRKRLDEMGYPDLDPNVVEWGKERTRNPRSMVALEMLG